MIADCAGKFNRRYTYWGQAPGSALSSQLAASGSAAAARPASAAAPAAPEATAAAADAPAAAGPLASAPSAAAGGGGTALPFMFAEWVNCGPLVN